VEVQRAARTHAVEAIETLATIMRTSRSPKARIAAAQVLLDRGYGRPPQAIAIAQLEGADGKPLKAPTFGISFSDGGPGQEGDVSPLLGEPSLALPAPRTTECEAPPALLLPREPEPPARASPEPEGPTIIDQATGMVASLSAFEALGRPAPPRSQPSALARLGDGFVDAQLLAGQRSREARAARRRAENEERRERENEEQRTAQRIREAKIREQEGSN
jgi:hypothetical protein